ncbi:MAG: hypothetical protein H6721_11010 [Sandaracinus sp.]|nr:hypothetical protein [Sandaracinus sp.]MCB9632650.1 hypothetical protein [Sandaracinus sp.]
MAPRFVVDFNEMIFSLTGSNAVLLSATDERCDVDGARVTLYEGLTVEVTDHELLAEGLVERHEASDWSRRARWRCRIQRWIDDGPDEDDALSEA